MSEFTEQQLEALHLGVFLIQYGKEAQFFDQEMLSRLLAQIEEMMEEVENS